MDHPLVRKSGFAIVLILLLLPPLFLSIGKPFYLDAVARMMIFAIAALSLDLILGFGGMISLGHAVYLGIGAYTVGILSYYGVTNGFVHFGMAVLCSAVAALIIGATSLRTIGVFFLMITLAFSQMAYFLAISINTFGGDDGLSIRQPSELGLNFRDPSVFYYFVLAALTLFLWLSIRIVNSRFGVLIRGIKFNESRMTALGFATFRYKLAMFVIAGGMCGFAGALFVNQTLFVSPSLIHWIRSGELLVMVIAGGMATLVGPVIGAIAFLLLENVLSAWTTYWNAWMGMALVLLVLTGKQGIVSRGPDARIDVVRSGKTERRVSASIRAWVPPNWRYAIGACMDRLGRYVTGWLMYYRSCTLEVTKEFRKIDVYTRHRFKAIVVRQKKHLRFLFRHLLAQGVSRKVAAGAAYCNRRATRRSIQPALTHAFPPSRFTGRLTWLNDSLPKFNSASDRVRDRKGSTVNDVLLSTRQLTKRFGGVVATDVISIEVRRGKLHAIIGPNGAGKTTLIAQLSGQLRPDSGTIHFAGVDVTDLPAHVRSRHGFARSFQITNIVRELTALDNVALAVQAHDGHSFRFWRPVRSDNTLRDPAMIVLKKVGLSERAHVMAGRLSHGEKRALEIGMALATRPALLLFDEPLAGMGTEDGARVIDLLSMIKAETTILLVEHDMDAVFALADTISVLVTGRIIATGTPPEIRTNPDVQLAYLGDEAEP